MYKVEFIKAELREGTVEVDGEKLAADLEDKLNEMREAGLDVFQIAPVISGSYDYKETSPGWGFGFSYTEGMLLAARKRPGK